jgi:hypothetical protein
MPPMIPIGHVMSHAAPPIPSWQRVQKSGPEQKPGLQSGLQTATAFKKTEHDDDKRVHVTPLPTYPDLQVQVARCSPVAGASASSQMALTLQGFEGTEHPSVSSESEVMRLKNKPSQTVPFKVYPVLHEHVPSNEGGARSKHRELAWQ